MRILFSLPFVITGAFLIVMSMLAGLVVVRSTLFDSGPYTLWLLLWSVTTETISGKLTIAICAVGFGYFGHWLAFRVPGKILNRTDSTKPDRNLTVKV